MGSAQTCSQFLGCICFSQSSLTISILDSGSLHSNDPMALPLTPLVPAKTDLTAGLVIEPWRIIDNSEEPGL